MTTTLAMTEQQLQDGVVELAKLLGWRVYFTWRSMHSPSGFPDLICARAGRLVALELKRSGRKPTLVQQQWLNELSAAGAEVYIITPVEWFAGDVDRIFA